MAYYGFNKQYTRGIREPRAYGRWELTARDDLVLGIVYSGEGCNGKWRTGSIIGSSAGFLGADHEIDCSQAAGAETGKAALGADLLLGRVFLGLGFLFGLLLCLFCFSVLLRTGSPIGGKSRSSHEWNGVSCLS